MDFKELEMFEIENALHRARIGTLVERLNEMLFMAGYIQAIRNPSKFIPHAPDTLYVRFDENFGNIDMRIYITDDYSDRYKYNIPGIRLDQDDLDAHIELMRCLLQSIFYRVVFENDLRKCEANLVHGDTKYPTLCREADGVWMCSSCYRENERNPKRR